MSYNWMVALGTLESVLLLFMCGWVAYLYRKIYPKHKLPFPDNPNRENDSSGH